jgi:hypothetical protein
MTNVTPVLFGLMVDVAFVGTFLFASGMIGSH